eukprot:symbB.v1.2.000943.t2/scaffold45.1/size390604/6
MPRRTFTNPPVTMSQSPFHWAPHHCVAQWRLVMDVEPNSSGSEELELEALGGSVPVALNEISTAALQVKEVMQELLHTADTMCDQSMDYEHDLIFLKEIGSSATQIAESLAMPMEKPSEDPIYSDSTLERAKRLAALSYELVEDIEMATDGYEEAAAQKGDEVACLNNVTKATCLVIEDMQRLQGERWAAGALAEILEEERRASMEKGVLVTSSKVKKVLEEEDDRLQSQKEWEDLEREAKQIVRLRLASETGRPSAAYDDVADADADAIDKVPEDLPTKKVDSDTDSEKDDEPSAKAESEVEPKEGRGRKRAGKKKTGAQKKRERAAREEGENPRKQKEEDDDRWLKLRDEKEDEAVLQVVAEDHFCFGEDPRMALLLKRTLARVRGESNGFDDAEKEDLHAAFLRFKVPDSADIHKDDLDALLNFVGRWVPPEEAITEMARKITMYDYMDFDEFLTFMTYYDEFERAEQQRIFKLYDKDGSGNISITELRCLLKKANVSNDESTRCSSTVGALKSFDLAELLSPVTLEEFQQRFFERQALHITRPRCPGYYAPLADLSSPERLFQLMRDGIVPLYRINMFRCVDGRTKETPPPPQSIEEVERDLMIFRKPHRILKQLPRHDALSAWVSSLESAFGCLVGVNAYLTPAGAQGLAPHWDDVDVFVLQLGGTKCWTLHRSVTSSPLAPEQQTLPRYSSGDLDPRALSDAFMRPKLLYFPRGIIHHAPNKDASSPSVHLTISTFQRQTLYDLVQKTFEEAMSELWEEDEALRKALPWNALTLRAPQNEMSAAVAKQLRRLADAVDTESTTSDATGPVAAALENMAAEFVRHRMPPQVKQDEACLVGLRHTVVLDTSALALLPVDGDEDEDAARMCPGHKTYRELWKISEEAEEEAMEADEVLKDPGQVLSGPVAKALRRLCTSQPKILQELLLEANVPKESWQEVCRLLTQLAALGLAKVKVASIRDGRGHVRFSNLPVTKMWGKKTSCQDMFV